MSGLSDPLRDIMRDAFLAQQAAGADGESEARRRAERAREQAEAESNAARQLRETGISLRAPDYAAVVGGHLDDEDALKQADAWYGTASDGAILVLLGGVGSGKTVAAAALMVHDAGGPMVAASGKAYSSHAITRLAASSYGPDADKLDDLLAYGGLMVVDDVGAELDVERSRHALFRIVDARQSTGRTVLTANLTVDAFRKRACDRTLSRLRQCGTIVSVKGSDMRGQS